MDPEAARLREQLSRAVADRRALQEALAARDSREADLRGALNVARAERQRLEDLLGPAAGAVAEKPPNTAAPAKPLPAAGPPKAVLRALPAAPVIEVRDLCKSYRLPARPVDTLKERALHPLRSRRATRLEALRDVSFDVHRGEFLGIAGANGSGKSTLLKLLANVYAADSGTIRSAGRVAPFIELGVGLNPEFAAYDNVVISGVMMGLEPEQARERYPEIIEFAGLGEFTELKLKNYSSGMRVRLAFAVMAQVDAEILLIDEVLAVGDAEFRQKCLTRLNQLREAGTTIVLVTHSMETIRRECDRGILLVDGRIREQGDPAEVARRYLSEGAGEAEPQSPAAVRLVEA